MAYTQAASLLMFPVLLPAGTLQLDMGCLTEAGTNLQRSFDIRAKLLGEENPRTQVSWA